MVANGGWRPAISATAPIVSNLTGETNGYSAVHRALLSGREQPQADDKMLVLREQLDPRAELGTASTAELIRDASPGSFAPP